ncbi:MAG: DUF6527 family protein, partial [Burkholderiales bacterium]|nr:DUF6527 family protein [Burkholderiales bacterium]
FVEFIPETIKDGVLYISLRYATAIHNCCCGCGEEVVTPLTPTDWSLTYDSHSVSLSPSIGSWSLPCQSHYFIKKNKVVWSGSMSQYQIDRGRAIDRRVKKIYFEKNAKQNTNKHAQEHSPTVQDIEVKVNTKNFLNMIKSWLFS